MDYQIKTIDELSLNNMAFLLRPPQACYVIQDALRYYDGQDSINRRPLKYSNIFGLDFFIAEHLRIQQRSSFGMHYSNAVYESENNPYIKAIEEMINEGKVYIVFPDYGRLYTPLLIPPRLLQDGEHWSLDPGIRFFDQWDRFKRILEKRLRELQVSPDPDTGKIIITGIEHMGWMHHNPRAYWIGKETEPEVAEPQLRPMEVMPDDSLWVKTKDYLARVAKGEIAKEGTERYANLLERMSQGDLQAREELAREMMPIGGITKVVGKTVGKGGMKRTPFGFKNPSEFRDFSISINSGLNKAGVDDAQVLFQGSAVTGKKFTTGEAFDAGRKSDFDLAISSPQLMQKAKEAGIPLRSQGTRTGPLSAVNLEKLGLSDLSKKLSLGADRPVNFMIFDSVETATNKAQSILVPK